ncbi:MAG: alpha/beta hydrolase [Candidatus Yanofskybacteria bacterium]|nr:alpha/beta hydrolase [Candidatus Yanofskybacteria bacterium]
MEKAQEQKIKLDARTAFLKSAGEGRNLLIIHGWGGSSDSWAKVQEHLAGSGFRVIVPDIPGFGKTPAPEQVWGTDEYAAWIDALAGQLHLQSFVLLGHSFGGQMAIKYALLHPDKVEKLILVAPAAIRTKPGLKERVLSPIAKVLKLLLELFPEHQRERIRAFGYKVIRRRDYSKAKGIMRKVFQKVIREDLSPRFAYLRPETLLLWGKEDTLTPLREAHELDQRLPHATLKVFAQHGHNLHAEMPEELSKEIVKFLS